MIKAWILIKFAYKAILRDLLIKAIDNPDSEVDEFIVAMLDRLFEYDG